MRTIIIMLIAGFTAACTSEPKYEIVLTNPMDRAVEDAAVVVPRTALEAIPRLEQGLQPVLTDINGANIPVQADDLDGDGVWDELFIVTDLGGGEKMSAALAFRSPDKLPELKRRTNLRFAKKGEEYREVTTAVREQHAVNTETQKVWQMEDEALDVVHDVTIAAGKYYYESEVTYTGTKEEVQLVSGIVNMLSEELHEVETGVAVKAFFTYDQQSEDGTRLGMGLMVSAEDFAGISEAPESGNGIVDTYCSHMKAAAGKPVKFRFYTVWEREDERWESAAGFEKLLREEAKRMVAPVTWSVMER